MLNKKILLITLSILFITVLTVFVLIIKDKRIVISKNNNFLYANNISSVFYKLSYANTLREMIFPFKENFEISGIENPDIVKIMKSVNGFYIQSKFQTGILVFEVRTRDKNFLEKIDLVRDDNDFDQDGFPDVAELITERDRESFIDWFASIAESQYFKESVKWESVHHDCAGLINFCYKEALKKHDNEWYKKFSYLVNKDIPDVSRYNYPEIPYLKDKIFRTKGGAFKLDELNDDTFSSSANANNIMNFNMSFVGRSISLLQKGDILFFNVIQNMPDGFHSMIYTANPDFLVYHTGKLDDNPKGEVRKVKVDYLFRHPDKNWHPDESNPSFLGIYRWKIIN